MDVATDFANPEIYSLVKKRLLSLAPVKDSKVAKKRRTVAAKQRSSASQTNVRQVLTFLNSPSEAQRRGTMGTYIHAPNSHAEKILGFFGYPVS